MVAEVQQSPRLSVLVVASDPDTANIVRLWLDKGGYDVEAVYDGFEGLKCFFREQPDLMVLGTTLPYMSGWELCRRIREISDIPIVMISDQAGIDDRLRGFAYGVDDYVAEPFDFRELLARVNAVTRRSILAVDHKKPVLKLGDLHVDFHNRSAYVRGIQVDLSPIEFRLLSCLVRNQGRTLSARQLLAEVWGPRFVHKTSYIKVYIRLLRKKIEENPSRPRFILTERDLGYRFMQDASDRIGGQAIEAPVDEIDDGQIHEIEHQFLRLAKFSQFQPSAPQRNS